MIQILRNERLIWAVTKFLEKFFYQGVIFPGQKIDTNIRVEKNTI